MTCKLEAGQVAIPEKKKKNIYIYSMYIHIYRSVYSIYERRYCTDDAQPQISRFDAALQMCKRSNANMAGVAKQRKQSINHVETTVEDARSGADLRTLVGIRSRCQGHRECKACLPLKIGTKKSLIGGTSYVFKAVGDGGI